MGALVLRTDDNAPFDPRPARRTEFGPRTRSSPTMPTRRAPSAVRRQLRGRNIAAVIPEKSDTIPARERRGSTGGRPPDSTLTSTTASTTGEASSSAPSPGVEQRRALVARSGKHVITYRAAITLFTILTRVRLLGDTP